MPNINFNDSLFIGTATGSSQSGLLIGEQSPFITFQSGLINNGSYIYPIRSVTPIATYTMSSSDCIVLLNWTFGRGTTNRVNLGNHPNGTTFYFRSVTENDTISLEDESINVNRVTIFASGNDLIRPTYSMSNFSSVVIGPTNSANPSGSAAFTYFNGIWYMTRNEDSSGLSV
jgi:hypothetical protein